MAYTPSLHSVSRRPLSPQARWTKRSFGLTVGLALLLALGVFIFWPQSPSKQISKEHEGAAYQQPYDTVDTKREQVNPQPNP